MSEPQLPVDNSSFSGEVQYAGFWIRFLAFLIDVVIVQIALQICFKIIAWVLWLLPNVRETIFKIATKWVNNLPDNQLALFNFSIFVIIVSAIVVFLIHSFMCWPYYALMESSHGQATLGKRICRLKLVRKDGFRISFARASARFWARIAHIFVFSTVGVIIGVILIGLFLPVIKNFAALSIFFGFAPIGLAFCGFVGCVPALFTARRQTLHDLMAGTVVVKAD